MKKGWEEAYQLLTELVDADVHSYNDNQDVLQCVLCGYQHRHFTAEQRVLQKQHYVECLVVRATLARARWRKERTERE